MLVIRRVLPTRLPSEQIALAAKLWCAGNDTTQIALILKAQESQVYNSLRTIRAFIAEMKNARKNGAAVKSRLEQT